MCLFAQTDAYIYYQNGKSKCTLFLFSLSCLSLVKCTRYYISSVYYFCNNKYVYIYQQDVVSDGKLIIINDLKKVIVLKLRFCRY